MIGRIIPVTQGEYFNIKIRVSMYRGMGNNDKCDLSCIMCKTNKKKNLIL